MRWKKTLQHFYYCTPTNLQEVNVFSRIFLSLCSHAMWPLQICSNWFIREPSRSQSWFCSLRTLLSPVPPRPVQTCSLGKRAVDLCLKVFLFVIKFRYVHVYLFFSSVYIESTSYNTLKLYLTSIDKSDEGFYTCEAYILGMKFEHKSRSHDIW